MSSNNGVVRIGRKGLKKFAFGEDAPFQVDVVVAYQRWIDVDESFRTDGQIKTEDMHRFHAAAVEFVEELSNSERGTLTVAEVLDFLARLREQYDELAVFFQPKSREEPASPATSGLETRFSVEAG